MASNLCGTDSHRVFRSKLVRSERFLAKQVLDRVLDELRPHAAPDQEQVGDVAWTQACLLERLVAHRERFLRWLFADAAQIRRRQLLDEVFRARVVGGDERQVDVRALAGRKLDLGLY